MFPGNATILTNAMYTLNTGTRLTTYKMPFVNIADNELIMHHACLIRNSFTHKKEAIELFKTHVQKNVHVDFNQIEIR